MMHSVLRSSVVVLFLGLVRIEAFSSHTQIPTTISSSGTHCRQSSTSLNAKEICVLGGGFGGLNAALTLSSLPWPEDDKPTITLVDKKERFIFLPLLYELCVGDAELEEVAPTYERLLKDTDIQFRQGDIQGIDAENDVVYINNKSTTKINYDSLIVATGADVNLQAIPKADKCALPFYTLEDCLELRKRLTLIDSIGGDFNEEIKVVIVGGGYSGVELALNMKERLENVGKGMKITLVHRGDEVLQYATEFNQKSGLERLQKAGVNIMTGTSVVEVTQLTSDQNDAFEFLDGRCKVSIEKDNVMDTLDADILLWTAGAMAKNTQRGILNSKLPRDSSGRMVTDKYLQVKGTDNVFALGDCARVKKVPYGATAAVAMQQAPVAAWNAYASIKNSAKSDIVSQQEDLDLLPFQYVNLGEMMTLGAEDATISSMGLLEVNGVGASILRRLIYAVRMPTVQQALTAALSSSGKRIEVLSRKQKVNKIIDWQ